MILQINQSLQQDQPIALLFHLNSHTTQLVNLHQALQPDLPAEIVSLLDKKESGFCASENMFVKIFRPTIHVTVVGAVHIAQELTKLCHCLSWQTTVIDPRLQFVTSQRFPYSTLKPGWPQMHLKPDQDGPFQALVVLSHDPKIDDPALEIGLNANYFYIGALGSKKTQLARRERLLHQGFTPEQCQRIRGPIGLNIHAKTPEEIAVSILAEIVLHFRSSNTG